MKHQFASIHGGLLARKGEASPAIPSPLSHVTYIDEAPHTTAGQGERRDVELNASAALMKTKPSVSPEVLPEVLPEAQAEIPVEPPASHVQAQVRDHVQASAEPAKMVNHEPDDALSDGVSGCCGGFAQTSAEPIVPSRSDKSAVDQKRTQKASMRLTVEQKRRLKTVAVQMNRPQQEILTEALDAYLDEICSREMKNCACLRARLS